jgi:CMP-N-acetylneuraminic acid synthetase
MDDQLIAHPDQIVDQRFIVIIAETDKCNVPGNYLAAIGGKPILSYSMEAAIRCVSDESKMAVYTDSLEVVEYIKRSGIQLVSLSTKRIGKYESLTEAIDYPSYRHKGRSLYVGLINPCFPFITATDIQNAFRLCEEQKDRIVGSVTLSDKSIWHYHLLQDDLFPKRLFLSDDSIRYGGLRQDDQPLYIINDAIRVFGAPAEDGLKESLGDIAYQKANTLYKLNRFSGMSVSTTEDLIIANAALSGGLAGKDDYV